MEYDLDSSQSIPSTTEPSPARDAKWVSRIIGCSVSQAYAKAASGEIPAFKCGRVVRFREDEVLAYREECRIRPRPTLMSAPTPPRVLSHDDHEDFRIMAVRRCG